jgi:hypothetical protein
MKRSRQQVDNEGQDSRGEAANLVPTTQCANPNKRRKEKEIVELKRPDHEDSSRNHASAPALSAGIISLSVIHGQADVAPHQDSSPPAFPYEPLDTEKLEIRVVVLRAGLAPSPIKCDLEHVTTTKALQKKKKAPHPSYKALSYTWGPPEVHKTIFLNGIEVQVRENLWQALQHLRSPDADLRLWIDAMCINQDHIPERNQQVSRMGTIYGMAKEVIVWLGPEKDDSNVAIDFIEKTTSPGNGRLSRSFFADHLVSSTPVKRAISKLVERDYWKRVVSYN